MVEDDLIQPHLPEWEQAVAECLGERPKPAPPPPQSLESEED